MHTSIKTRCASFILLSLTALPAQASFFDTVKAAYEDVEKHVKHLAQVDNATQSNPQSEAFPPTEQPHIDLPSHWRTDVVTEPVFNAELFTLHAGEQHKQTVLLVHGLGQNGHKDWLNVIPTLEETYHVLAIDLPGFGNSSSPPGRYSPTNYAGVLSWVVDEYAKGPVALVGHSMGGAVALRFASTYPDKVSNVTLVDAAGILERTAFLKHMTRLPIPLGNAPKPLQKLGTQLVDLGGSVIELTALTPDPTKILNTNSAVWNRIFNGKPNANAALALVDEDFGDAIRTLPHNTSIIWGENDPVAPLRTGRMLAAHINNADLTIIPGAEHVPMNSHVTQFNQHLLEAISTANTPPLAATPQPSQGDLECDGASGEQYEGRYDHIRINQCTGVSLINVVANRLTVEDSVVDILDSRIISKRTGLSVKESVITATNLSISGKTGIRTDGSRLDFAGVSIKGGQIGITIENSSRLLFSVSNITSPLFSGYVHGDYKENDIILDTMLPVHHP